MLTTLNLPFIYLENKYVFKLQTYLKL